MRQVRTSVITECVISIGSVRATFSSIAGFDFSTHDKLPLGTLTAISLDMQPARHACCAACLSIQFIFISPVTKSKHLFHQSHKPHQQ